MIGRHWHGDGEDAFQQLVLLLKDLQQGVTHVFAQMPAVGDLDGVGGTGSRAFGIPAASVAGNGRYPRMGTEPLGQGVGLPIRQQVDGLLPFVIDENRAIGNVSASASPGRPPAISPIARCVAASRPVRRAHGAARLGIRSVKIRHAHPSSRQRNVRTVISPWTAQSAQGKSASVRR